MARKDPEGKKKGKRAAARGDGAPESFLSGEYTTALHEAFSYTKVAPSNLIGLNGFWTGSLMPTFCNWMCRTLGGGYTCPVYRAGKKLHDSIDVYPCAYTLGFDPGCKMPA